MNRTNARRTAIAIGLISLAITVGAVSTSWARELELPWVAQLKVQETDVQGKRVLKVSGLCGHSSYKVKKVAVEKTPTGCNITVQTRFALFSKKSATGNFVANVPLDSGVQEVTFGKKRERLWPPTKNGKKTAATK